MLKPIAFDHNISAITGIANTRGDYRGPEKNSGRNPDNYWTGTVLTAYGWSHIQEIGREAVEKLMKTMIANSKPR